MSAKSSIEWTDASWTPLRARVKTNAVEIAQEKGYGSLRVLPGKVGPHCEHTSPGCSHCYSETNNGRCLPSNGTGLPFDRRARDLVDTFLDEKILTQPLHWRAPRKVFVCSQTDLFGEWVTDELIDRVFAVMALCPQHTFQVLTKRAKRMREYFSNASGFPRWERVYDRAFLLSAKWQVATPSTWPLPNVHLGVSVEDQQRADERIPELLQTPAAVRFLSVEPLLGPVDLTRVGPGKRPDGTTGKDVLWRWDCGCEMMHVDWVIVGGESGPGARPCNTEWIRSIVQQCQSAVTPVFVKQLGAHVIQGGARRIKKDKKGGDPSEREHDLRVRETPAAGDKGKS